MKQIRKFSDCRLSHFCVYCGNQPNTRDHVPSKILLDKPYPENLPVVPSCSECNQRFSADEEYVACLIECILMGSTNPENINRNKIKRILSQKPILAKRIKKGYRKTDEGIFFEVENDRIRNIILKLGRGHVAFENSDPQLEKPSYLGFSPLPLMSSTEINTFFNIPSGNIYPELGSRAFTRVISGLETPIQEIDWLIVQPERYRYSFKITDSGLIIRMILSEYLAGIVIWQ